MKRLAPCVALALLAGCATLPHGDTAAVRQLQAEVAAQLQPDAVPAGVREALLPPLAVSPPRPQMPRFNLVLNQAPAAQVFMGIVNGTPYSMLVPPGMTGLITLNLKHVTLFEALDAIRDLYGYDYKVEGQRILVMPQVLQTRVFHVDYIPGERREQSSIQVSSGSLDAAGSQNGTSSQPSATGHMDSSRIDTSAKDTFWEDLSRSLQAIVGSGDGRDVVINPQSGIVVVRAMPRELRTVADFLGATQASVDRQVLLEAKIIEVDLNRDYQAGIDWAAFRRGAASIGGIGQIDAGALRSYEMNRGAIGDAALSALSGAGADAPPAGSIFGIAVHTNSFDAVLGYLETQGTVHVLSSPRIATINNQSALLKVGSDDFFPTGISNTTSVAAGATTSTPSVTLQPFFSGIALDVMPEIDAHGNVILHVHPSVSQVSTRTKQINLGQGGNLVLPLASSYVSETDSVIRARDGQVVVIGGLMKMGASQMRSGVPGLGALLGEAAESTTKQELVILLKPTVVEGNATWANDILDTRSRVNAMDGNDAGEGNPE